MSDSRIYELEDIVWELCDSDDHIVPQPGDKDSKFSAECGSNKRPRLQLRCAESSVENRGASYDVIQPKGEKKISSVKEETGNMMDNSPRTHLSGGDFSSSLDGDSNGKNTCSASDEERTFDHCMTTSSFDPTCNGISSDDPILEEKAASVDNNLYQYELNNATQTENDLDFFSSSLDDKENNDLLYYGWNEIENFEDVDRMFRNCDSTFGLDIDNNVELGWFSSSHAMEVSDEAIKSSFNFPGCDATGLNGVTEQQEVYELNYSGLVADEKLAPVNCKRGSRKLTANDPSAVMNACLENGSKVVSGIDSASQIHSHQPHVRHSEQQKQSEGKRKERPSENVLSFIHFDSLSQAAESNHSINFRGSSTSENHQQMETSHHNSVHMPISLIKPNNSQSSDQGLHSSPSSKVKCVDSGLPSISPSESSYASSQMQSVEKVHSEKGYLMAEKAGPNPICDPKLCENENENEVEGQSEVDNEVGIATERDSSNMQESSCMSSVLDEISIDASSFQQLQNVMEKLDVRTKLCIRDSLYRLARSAERRHKCVNPASGSKDDKDTSETLQSDGTNKCSGFMDMETDTNPIDRSIAHLLFHRPSDSSATAPFDTLPVKSQNMDQGCNNGPLIAKKLDCQDETTSANGEAARL